MSKKYKPNIPRSGVSPKAHRADTDTARGFQMAILAGAVVLNDIFDFEDADLTEWMEKTNELIGSIAADIDKPKYMIRELEKMTGYELDFTQRKEAGAIESKRINGRTYRHPTQAHS